MPSKRVQEREIRRILNTQCENVIVVIGQALIIKGGVMDSLKDPVKPFQNYEVAKHKPSGSTIILPTTKPIDTTL